MNNVDYPASITITLRPKYNKEIRELAKQENVSLNFLISEIIMNFLLNVKEEG